MVLPLAGAPQFKIPIASCHLPYYDSHLITHYQDGTLPRPAPRGFTQAPALGLIYN